MRLTYVSFWPIAAMLVQVRDVRFGRTAAYPTDTLPRVAIGRRLKLSLRSGSKIFAFDKKQSSRYLVNRGRFTLIG